MNFSQEKKRNDPNILNKIQLINSMCDMAYQQQHQARHEPSRWRLCNSWLGAAVHEQQWRSGFKAVSVLKRCLC